LPIIHSLSVSVAEPGALNKTGDGSAGDSETHVSVRLGLPCEWAAFVFAAYR